MTPMQFLFSFDGRIRRSEWWLSRLCMVGAYFVGTIIFFGGAAALPPGHGSGISTPGDVLLMVLGLLAALGFFAVLWVHFATSAKRLHDLGLTGWLALVTLVPGIGVLFAIIVLGCLDSQQKPNGYGPSAKYPSRQVGQFA